MEVKDHVDLPKSIPSRSGSVGHWVVFLVQTQTISSVLTTLYRMGMWIDHYLGFFRCIWGDFDRTSIRTNKAGKFAVCSLLLASRCTRIMTNNTIQHSGSSHHVNEHWTSGLDPLMALMERDEKSPTKKRNLHGSRTIPCSMLGFIHDRKDGEMVRRVHSFQEFKMFTQWVFFRFILSNLFINSADWVWNVSWVFVSQCTVRNH